MMKMKAKQVLCLLGLVQAGIRFGDKLTKQTQELQDAQKQVANIGVGNLVKLGLSQDTMRSVLKEQIRNEQLAIWHEQGAYVNNLSPLQQEKLKYIDSAIDGYDERTLTRNFKDGIKVRESSEEFRLAEQKKKTEEAQKKRLENPPIGERFMKGITETGTAIGTSASNVAGAIATGASAAGSAIYSGGKTAVSGIGSAARTTGNAIGTAASSAASGAQAAGRAVAKAAKTSWAATQPARDRVSAAYTDAKDRLSDVNSNVQAELEYAKNYDDANGGKLTKWMGEQNEANMARIQKNALETSEAANAMLNKMTNRRDEFQQDLNSNIASLNENFDRFLSNLNEGMTPLQMNLIAGAGTDLDGKLIEAGSFEFDMFESDEEEVWATVGEDESDKTISSSKDILDLIIEECYHGQAQGDQETIKKNCLKADILTFRCESPIDAAFFIGVTFDITQGYNTDGFRGKLVKHWCREHNTYNGEFDVPDGMHVQGVYSTNVKTETFSSVDEYIDALTEFSNSQSGNSSFKATRNQLDSRSLDTKSKSMSIGGGMGGMSASGSTSESRASASQKADAKLTSTKNQEKAAELNENLTKKIVQTRKLVGEMTINVIRYEMFLREVKPNYIHEDFLDAFLKLPTSFFAPNSPELFQDFIQKYGTHYVKGAKFGGQFKVVKTHKVTSESDIKDFKKEVQKQINEIVGNAIVKQRAAKAGRAGSASVGGSVGYGGFSASANAAEAKSESVSESQQVGSQSGSATTTQTAEGIRNVETKKKKTTYDSTVMTVSGGSHRIATSITDLYSLGFRTGLMKWLQSIPHFTKPFDMVFETIPNLLNFLINKMLDPDMYKACILNKQETVETFVLDREQVIPCNTNFGRESQLCQIQCANEINKTATWKFEKDVKSENYQRKIHIANAERGFNETAECKVNRPRIMNCNEVVNQKEKFQRRISALDTAIQLYIKEGDLNPKSFITIPVQAPGCTTAYRIARTFDDFDKEFGESESIDWSIAAFRNLQLQFNMKKFFFNKRPPAEEITPNAHFTMYFDSRDRRWYTKEAPEDPLLPQDSSQAMSFIELKSQATDVLGEFRLVPLPFKDGDDEFVQIRLKHGLYVEVNLKNKDVIVNRRSVNAMRSSSDVDVIEFYAAYSEILEEMADSVDGEVVGFLDPIIRDNSKTPMPCAVAWANSQMYEATDDVQQCVKVTVLTSEEYFFVMGSSLTDVTSWIYVHQTQNTLCVHKLDDNGDDEINSCAPRLQYMVTGQVENMAEQLYVCIYKYGDLLSISLQRPTYNRQDKESGTTILTYNYVEKPDKSIFPRYYALAAGESKVEVKSIYMVELKTLQCQLPFISQNIGGTSRCVLECHAECSDKGCNAPNDNTACLECRNSKYLARFEGKPDVPTCIPTCEMSNDKRRRLITDESKRDPGVPGQKVCSQCHHECKTTCNGFTEYDCEGDEECVHYKIFEGTGVDRVPKCVKECPEGYWAREYEETPNLIYPICEPCPDGCKRCDLGHFHKPGDGTVETVNENVIYESCEDDGSNCFDSDICFECLDNYLSAVVNITHKSCHETACPYTYQLKAGRCEKLWKPIGYQKMAVPQTVTDEATATQTVDETTGSVSTTATTTEVANTQGGFGEPPSCDATSCTITAPNQVNYLNMVSAADFENYKNIQEQMFPCDPACTDPTGGDACLCETEWVDATSTVTTTHGIWCLQYAWKIDDSTVFVLEWTQNFNPLREYTTYVAGTACNPPDCLPKGKKAIVNVFEQRKCVTTTEEEKGLRSVAFDSPTFFNDCPEIVVQGEDPEEIIAKLETAGEGSTFSDLIGFTGVEKNANNKDYVIKGSASDLYSFGILTMTSSEAIQSYKLMDGTTFYSDEMQFSVMDNRWAPIGWSQWEAFDAAGTATTCGMDCATGDVTIAKRRHCRCFDITNGVIRESHTYADFNTICQPCEGDSTKDEECELTGCTATDTSPTYHHHHCCEESTAFRIIGSNFFGRQLGFDGIYELVYNKDDDTAHEYIHLKDSSTKKIVRQDSTDGDYYWTLMDGTTEILRSAKSKCPMDADKWGVLGVDWDNNGNTDNPGIYLRIADNDVQRNTGKTSLGGITPPVTGPYPELILQCSKGKNACPADYPYSYARGAKCCISPFSSADAANPGSLLTPDSVEADCVGSFNGGNGYTDCPLNGNRRCRSNLDDIAIRDFKATDDKRWRYQFGICAQHCNVVYMVPELVTTP